MIKHPYSLADGLVTLGDDELYGVDTRVISVNEARFQAISFEVSYPW